MDAIEAIYRALSQKGSSRWVLDADIAKCFDQIDHAALLGRLPVFTTTIRRWLKAGAVEVGTLKAATMGTPQGGIISPPLVNIALDCMERWFGAERPDGRQVVPSLRKGSDRDINLIRYADDFVFPAPSRKVLENEVMPRLAVFLADRGLELNAAKTRIMHVNAKDQRFKSGSCALPRGDEPGGFLSGASWIETIISIAGFYYFFAHSLTTPEPFVRFELFKDRNFVAGVVFMVVIGVVLFGTMALITPFMQQLLGYPIQTAGFLLGSRGVGTPITMMVAPRLMRLIETRYLMLAGLLIAGVTLHFFTKFSLDTTQETIVVTSIMQGIGLGLLFVPITTAAFLTLPGHLRNSGTAILTLVRNIGSSVGISLVIVNLTNESQYMHARLAAQVTPFNNALQFPDVHAILDMATQQGRALMDMIVTQQATLIGYLNDYKLSMIINFAVIPLVLIIGTSKKPPSEEEIEEAAVLE